MRAFRFVLSAVLLMYSGSRSFSEEGKTPAIGEKLSDEQVAQFLKVAKTANDNVAIDRIPSEGPVHRVRIRRPFYLGQNEVTQGQWEILMGDNPSHFVDSPLLPVEQVSWDDVQPFLKKLTQVASQHKLEFALPTEAQWEFACRAGRTTDWHFGDNQNALAEYGWFKGTKSQPVGRLLHNGFGLYDMHGNVFEWCADWWAADYYANSPINDPAGPDNGSHRVLRGGGWYHSAYTCRSAYRHFYNPSPADKFLGHLGFRCAASIEAVDQKLGLSPDD